MAKGNQVLGTSLGKLGDIVQYRMNGEPMSRVRVRHITNPRTENQAAQRNFMAPVSRFYAPFAIPLETSFEGLSKGRSYNEFMRLAVNKARAEGYYLPKGEAFVPVPYQVSRGTLPSINVSVSATDAKLKLPVTDENAPLNFGSFSKDIIASYGAKNGDQITILLVTYRTIGVTTTFMPTYTRFFLDVDSTKEIEDVVEGLTVIYTPNNNEARIRPLERIDVNNTATFGIAGACVILSRWENDKWRRSTEVFSVTDEVLAMLQSEDGRLNAIASYMDGENTPISPIYLNGGANPAGGLDVRLTNGAFETLVGLVYNQPKPSFFDTKAETNGWIFARTQAGYNVPIVCMNNQSDAYKTALAGTQPADAVWQRPAIENATMAQQEAWAYDINDPAAFAWMMALGFDQQVLLTNKTHDSSQIVNP